MERAVDAATTYPLGSVLSLLQRWWALNHAFEQVSRKMAARLGVTAQQRVALRVIGKYPGIGPSELAGVLHLDAGTISATLRRLEGIGAVARRQVGRDRRRVALGLTAQGRALDVDDPRTVEGALRRALAQTAPDDAAAVRRFLDAFVGALEEAARGE